MVIGAATIELEVTDSATLKDKRHVVKSVLDRVRGRFNISAAEVDRLDSPRHATLALAVVANDRAFVHSVLEKAVDLIEREGRALVTDYSIEIF